MLESLFTLEALISLATLTALEIVLGIDNIIFNNLYKHIFYPIFKLDSSRL